MRLVLPVTVTVTVTVTARRHVSPTRLVTAVQVLTTEIKNGDDYSEFVVAIATIYFVESPNSFDVLALCRLLLNSAEHEKSTRHRAACVSAWTFLFVLNSTDPARVP